MATTRREFLCATTGAFAGLTLAGTARIAGANQATPRVRKDVATLTATSPEIVALTKAVDKMKKGTGLGANDRRRWKAQAEIHGKVLGAFGKCQHASWYFLPWHRGYLYYFEEIVRELSQDDSFALPYWNWSNDRTLPALFWGANNPLHNPPRAGEPGSGRRPSLTSATKIPDSDYNRLLSKTVISQIVAINDFETFAGSAVNQLGDQAAQGRLENAPHNYVHVFVGGDMGTGGSPMDPIFWLHHCNVDRIWTQWAARNPQSTPSDAAWLNTSIPHFCDRQGNATAITVKKTLSTTNLDYVYDTQLTPLAVNPVAQPQMVLGALSLAEGLVNHSRSFQAPASESFAESVVSLSSVPDVERKEAVRLKIRGIEPPEDPNVVLDLFLNCENISPDTPITDKSYVGSCTFFLHGAHADGGGHAAKEHGKDDDGISFAFDLTREFVKLYGGRPLAKDEPLKVSILARPLVLDAESPSKSEVQVQDINPQQVSIEVVRREPA